MHVCKPVSTQYKPAERTCWKLIIFYHVHYSLNPNKSLIFLNHSPTIRETSTWLAILSLVQKRTPCICTSRAPDSSPGRASRHGVVRPDGLNPKAFTPTSTLLSPKLVSKSLIRNRFQGGVPNLSFELEKKWIIGLEVSNIKISTSSPLAFSKCFIQLDIKSKIKSCTIW